MSKWYNLHIKNEILLWFFILSLAPLLILTGLNYLYQIDRYEEEAKKKLSLILDTKINVVQNYTENIYSQISVLSKSPSVKNALADYKYQVYQAKYNYQSYHKKEKHFEDFFTQVINENNYYDLFLIDVNGDILYTVKKESDLHTNLISGPYASSNLGKLFVNTKKLLNTQISNFSFYLPSNDEACFIAKPIYGNKKMLGVIAVQLSTEKIREIFLSQEALGRTGEFYAAKLENDQVISTTPLKSNQNSVKEKYQFNKTLDLPIVKAVNGESGIGQIKDYNSKEVIAAWGYIPHFEWGVVVKMDLNEILEPLESLKFYSAIILFFVSLGIAIAIFIAIKTIVEPIEKLNKNVKDFAYGKLEENTNLELDNEVGELSKSFIEMAHSLKKSQNTIQKYADELEQKVILRTQDLEDAKHNIEKKNKQMTRYLNIIDNYVITSTTDLSGTITQVSKAFCNITGYEDKEMIGRKHNIIRHPDMSSELYKDLWETIQKGLTWQGEIKNLKKDGSFYWVYSTISPVFDNEGNITAYTSIRQDITNRKIIEEISITDQLTKLYNRRKIDNVFKEEINRAKRFKEKFSVILLDVDHFKEVNDTYGHDTGDRTLIEVANILKDSVRETDIVARWGGEEFIIITIGTPIDQACLVAEKIRKKIESTNFKIIGSKTASFGVTSYQEGDTENTIMKRADKALYESKANGRNQVTKLDIL